MESKVWSWFTGVGLTLILFGSLAFRSAEPNQSERDGTEDRPTTTTATRTTEPVAEDDRPSNAVAGDPSPDVTVPAWSLPPFDADYFFDFSQPLGPEWQVYESVGHAGWGLRRPSSIAIVPDPDATGGSVLTITAKMGTGDEADQLISGGMKLLRPQIYGSYTMRVKVDPDPDKVTSGAALLWPASNQWPRDGEIDIIETYASRDTRTPVESNLHWLNPKAEEPYVRADDAKHLYTHPGVDGTEWHVFHLEWREDLVSISVDGADPLILSTDPDEIADWPMEPTLQLDAFDSPDRPGRQPRMTGSVTMYVDYIAVNP